MLVFPTLNMVYCTYFSGLFGYPPHSLPLILPYQSLTPNLHRISCVERTDLGLWSIFSNLVAWLLPTGGEGGLHGYSPLVERVGCMVTLHWGRGWVAWLLPTGGEGGLHGHFLLGKLIFGYFPLGKLGFRVFPTGGESGSHSCSPLGERVGCTVTSHWGRGWVQWLWSSHWGSWFHGTLYWGRGWVYDYSLMEERVGEMVIVFPLGKLVYGYSPLGERVGYMITPHWGREWVKWSWSFPLGKLVSWLLPVGGEDGLHS